MPMQEAPDRPTQRSPQALGRADVRRCGTLWRAGIEPREGASAWPDIPNGRIRLATGDDIELVRRAMVAVGADNPGLSEVRLRGGRLGFLAQDRDTGEILAYAWVAQAGDKIDDLGFPLLMPRDEVWVYDCATVPAARGRGIYPAVLRAVRIELARRGKSAAWIGTAPRNWSSQRGIAHAGFAKIADADWSDMRAVLYGIPGVPEEALTRIADATGDIGADIRPNAGIPWIEALLETTDGTRDIALPEGLRRFRQAYGAQIQWTTRAAHDMTGELPRVTLTVNGGRLVIAGPARYEAYAAALDELAPGLPLLGE